MRRLRSLLLVLCTTGAGLASLSGCNDPCHKLSEKICKCEPDTTRSQACLDRVSREAHDKNLSDDEQQRCEDILDDESCTCKHLAGGDLAACGLVRDPASGR